MKINENEMKMRKNHLIARHLNLDILTSKINSLKLKNEGTVNGIGTLIEPHERKGDFKDSCGRESWITKIKIKN